MPWSRPSRALCSTILTILLACRSTAVLAAGWKPSCETEMVSRCWADTADSVRCLSHPSSDIECSRSSPQNIFCSGFFHAMSCSSDLVEEIECTFSREGRRNYGSWIRGVEAVFTGLCYEGLLDELVSLPCCSLEDAISCVQRRLGVQHLVDLLRKAPGDPGCHQSMAIAMSCWQQAQSDSSCEETVARLLASFFLMWCSDSDAPTTGSSLTASSFSTAAAAATFPNTQPTQTPSWSSPRSRVREAQRRPGSAGAAAELRVRGRQVAVVALLLLSAHILAWVVMGRGCSLGLYE